MRLEIIQKPRPREGERPREPKYRLEWPEVRARADVRPPCSLPRTPTPIVANPRTNTNKLSMSAGGFTRPTRWFQRFD
jgi:hypothetical protein